MVALRNKHAEGFRRFDDADAQEGANDESSPRGQPLPYGTGQLSWWSEMLFSWYNPLLAVGCTRALDHNDVWVLPHENCVAEWSRQCTSARGSGGGGDLLGDFVEGKLRPPGLVRGSEDTPTTLQMLWRSPLRAMYTTCGFLRLLAELGSMSSPLCLNQIMRYLNDSDTLLNVSGSHTRTEAAVLVMAMFFASVCQSIALQHYIALCFASGAHAKALVCVCVHLCVAMCVCVCARVRAYMCVLGCLSRSISLCYFLAHPPPPLLSPLFMFPFKYSSSLDLHALLIPFPIPKHSSFVRILHVCVAGLMLSWC